MKVRAQIGMVLNLDKCIGCHTCSITCKNVWTSREGVEYAWFNNVESKPGIGYPKEWENQEKWHGGWKRNKNGTLEPRQGNKRRLLANIFSNPDLPEIDDYYEPFVFTEIEVDSTLTDLPQFAKDHETTYKMLRKYNPWIDPNARYKLIVAADRKYTVRIPKPRT